jgi:cadmium resistance protein CadD (predicted permease)
MIQNIVTSALAFASTNIDDLFILVLFFGSKRFKTSHVFLGQYLGISTLVLISTALSFVSLVVSQHVIGLLGLFPMYLGIKQALSMWGNSGRQKKQHNEQLPGGMFAIAGTTIANGGDNIGVYVPLLSTQSGHGEGTVHGGFWSDGLWMVCPGKICCASPLTGKLA